MADAAAQPLNGRRAFVLGGGVAGIAAALALRARGFAVELLEAHAWLGGRVFSRHDERLGSARDNGPHVMLGCYDAFRRLLRELGTEAHFVRAPALAVAYADGAGRRSALRLRPWPVPCAMPLALLGRRDLPLAARLRALWGMLGVLAGAGEGAALADWLRRWRQHGAPRDLLWQPLCLAVMNCEPEAASARVFLRTMRRAFTGSAARGAIWLPDAPWGEIVGEPARRVLAERGVRVRHGARVRALRVAGGRVAAVVGEGFAPIDVGERDVVVTTLPWQRLAACLPPDDPVAAGAATLQARPIASVYFALDDDVPIGDAPLVVLAGGEPFHFLVRRPSDPRGRFALLAGGTEAARALSAEDLVRAACAQLARHFPGAVADPSRARAVKEARATFLAAPGSDDARPACGPHPRLPNLLLAGDWCATGLPATLEGATVSVEAALRHVPAE